MNVRLDQYLFQNNLVPSRERAKALIMAGIVYINNIKAEKAGMNVKPDDLVEIRGKDLAYVSRGGLKLEKAFKEFSLNLENKTCMDIGASTGGFTDCMLQNGASKVYSVDVGYGQLAWKLRCDERVVNLERTNIRHVTKEMVPDEISFFSVDVSFISLKHIFPVAFLVSKLGATGVCLIKPQFEAGREKVGKKGVVREASTHLEVIKKCIGMARENGFLIEGLSFSPIKGPEGNVEFLLYVRKPENEDEKENTFTDETPDLIVKKAHSDLVKREVTS